MARQLVVSVPHSLPQEDALARIQKLLSDARNAYGSELSEVSEKWSGYRCEFKMKMWLFPLSGTIEVDVSSVEVKGKLPLGTGRYEEKARALIEQRVHVALNPKPRFGPSDTIAGPPPTFRPPN